MRELFEYIINAFAALMIFILISPFFLMLFLVGAGSNGDIFFVQERLGESGKPFQLIKFRTLAVTLLPEDAVKPGSVYEMTRYGRFIRRFHLDELPQLLNVIRGDMNIVGCRPVIPSVYSSVKEQIPNYDVRLSYKPGITDYAQVKMGYASTIEEEVRKFEYDSFYIKTGLYGWT